ncbi:SCO family protein [Luteibacter sp.]|jgi:protein SCO1/2|uniref:SCO family protein n=1 Tax=Luteibacter sp. TaxID=1886636 RepID=UPI002F3E75F2
MIRLLVSAFLLLLLAPAFAAVPPPRDLDRRAGFDQHIGARVPMDVPLTDADGHAKTLATIADGKPLLLAFGYYRCPNLCDLTLRGIASAVARVPLGVGADYQVAFVSIAPNETALDAREARDLVARMEPQGQAIRWTWATAAPPSVATLTHTVGFRYFRDPRDGQYVHPAGFVVVAPDGRVAQYFFGVDYDAHALRLALVDASHGRLGTVIDRLVLLCCGYDPATGRYSLLVSRLMMALGCAFLVVMAAGALWLRRRTP